MSYLFLVYMIVDVLVLMLWIFPQMLEKPWSSYPSHLLIVWDSTTYFECYSIASGVWISLAKEIGCGWLYLPKNVLHCCNLSHGTIHFVTDVRLLVMGYGFLHHFDVSHHRYKGLWKLCVCTCVHMSLNSTLK